MPVEYARPRPVIEFTMWGEIKIEPKRSRELAAFLRKLDTVVKVENKGDGIVHFQTSDPSISLIVSTKFKKNFIHFRTLEMKTAENY
jgi:hypothetical protein